MKPGGWEAIRLGGGEIAQRSESMVHRAGKEAGKG